MGFGFGGAFTTLTIIVQESVEYNKRGAATATNSLLSDIRTNNRSKCIWKYI